MKRKTFNDLVQGQVDAAMDRYNSRYNNKVYQDATAGSNSQRANRLIDTALAVCGHPYYKVEINGWWSEKELEFLALFGEDKINPAGLDLDLKIKEQRRKIDNAKTLNEVFGQLLGSKTVKVYPEEDDQRIVDLVLVNLKRVLDIAG